jgi:hypothetical protein
MAKQEIGPREKQLQALRESGGGKYARKPSVADLRKKVAKVKPMTKHGGKRGR